MTVDPSYESTARFYDAAYAAMPSLGPDAQFYETLAAEIGGPVLEVGCGTGRVLLPIAARGIECAGVDSSPAIAGGRVYIGSNDNRFYVLDLATGKKLWEFEASAPLSASPAVAEGRVVIGSQDGRLYCFG